MKTIKNSKKSILGYIFDGINPKYFFEFFAFRNRAQGNDRVGCGDKFPPPTWGYPPWYAQEGSDKVKNSEIFGMTKKNCPKTK